MKPKCEELERPEIKNSLIYTSDTHKAIAREIKRGGDPYKLARYFDVDIKTVLRMQKRQRILDELLRRKDGDNTGT